MKHINKKTLEQYQLDKDKLSELNIPKLPDGKLPQMKYKNHKDQDAFIITDTGVFYRNFFITTIVMLLSCLLHIQY